MKRNVIKVASGIVLIGVILLTKAEVGLAVTLVMDVNININAPAGLACLPENAGSGCGSLTFTDTGANLVTLDVFNASNTTVSAVYLNFAPDTSVANLAFSNVVPDTFLSSFSLATDGFQLDGGGDYDVQLLMSNFTNNSTANMLISCIVACPGGFSFDATSFNVISEGGAPAKQAYAGFSVTPNPGNDNVGASMGASPLPPPGQVPEPTSLLLLGVGLAGLAAWKRHVGSRNNDLCRRVRHQVQHYGD